MSRIVVYGYIVFNIYALFFLDYGLLIKIFNILNIIIFGALAYRQERRDKSNLLSYDGE